MPEPRRLHVSTTVDFDFDTELTAEDPGTAKTDEELAEALRGQVEAEIRDMVEDPDVENLMVHVSTTIRTVPPRA